MKLGMAVNGTPDAERKSCYDCQYCQGAVSLWCMNNNAINDRRTQIPGTTNCPHWKPIATKEELYENANYFSKLFGIYKWGRFEVDLSKNEK